MADPDTFEEDLFADLYNDDEAPLVHTSKSEVIVNKRIKEEANDDGDDYAPQHDDHVLDNTEDDRDSVRDEDEDEVDFNLGATTSTGQPSPDVSTPVPVSFGGPRASSKDDGKMFIGGLNWETTDQSLRDYFSHYGEVLECTVMRDSATGRSRGFGFLTFKDPKTVNIVMVKEHFLDGKIIDPKRAIPRDEQERTSKIFVGGVSQDTTDQEFKEYFAQFGRVVDATLMMDKDTGRPRGFGFVTFESEVGVDLCINARLELHGKPIEVKRAQPRGNLREDEDTSKRGKFRKGGADDQMSGQQVGGMANQALAGGMSPQVMAQYFQRMQQWMVMVQQQQAAMSRGMGGMGAMNPGVLQVQQMMQMQQMKQMQQMAQMQQQQMMGGDASGQNMAGNMTPQMMQQLQQMQQQMQQQMMVPAGQANVQVQGGSNISGGAQVGGRPGEEGVGNSNSAGGFDQYEQQRFEQQRQQYGQSAGYGMGGGGGGGGGGTGAGAGGMTSWEGMYDDVPQPNFGGQAGGRTSGQFGNRGRGAQVDLANVPPANAPTGPRNAGKPGANYRGGGRGGGSRGFHPYAR